MIRPQIRAWLARWSELLLVLGVIALGLWLIWIGGYFFLSLGALILLVGLALAIGVWRRLPFYRDISAPGMVELVEGAVRYYGTHVPGGEIALRDLVEIRLMRVQGRDYWQLRSRSGEALLIPVDAAGAEGLAHAFTALPGIDMGAVSAALGRIAVQPHTMQTVWLRID